MRTSGDDDEEEEPPSDVRCELRGGRGLARRSAHDLEPARAEAIEPLHEDDAKLGVARDCVRILNPIRFAHNHFDRRLFPAVRALATSPMLVPDCKLRQVVGLICTLVLFTGKKNLLPDGKDTLPHHPRVCKHELFRKKPTSVTSTGFFGHHNPINFFG